MKQFDVPGLVSKGPLRPDLVIENLGDEFFTFEGTVTLLPDSKEPVYADVSVTIVNGGDQEVDSRIVLDVSKDGVPVESFPLVPALVLSQGETTVTQRYIPPAGWTAGTWTFELRLEVVDVVNNTSTTVATLDTIYGPASTPSVQPGPPQSEQTSARLKMAKIA